jgi:hypothetical protein
MPEPSAARVARPVRALVVIALVAVTWPFLHTKPTASLDGSWQLGLHLAGRQPLAFGKDVLFNYGPLGIAAVPLAISRGSLGIGFAFLLASRILLATSLLLCFERWMRPRFAWLPAFATLAVIPGTGVTSETASLAGVLFVTAAGLRGAFEPIRTGPLLLAACWAALLTLIKVNVGPFLAVAAGLAALAARAGALRRLAAVCAAFTGALIGLWIAVGQPLAGLATWLGGALGIVAGYSEAMAYEDPERAWEYGAAAATAALLAVAIARGADRSDALRFGARVAILAALGFAFFKAAFVRHDGHGTFFFLYLLLAPLWIEWRPRAAAVAAICCAAAGAILLAAGNIPAQHALNPRVRLERFVADFELFADADLRLDAQRQARASMRSQFPLEPALLTALGNEPVHIDPYRTSLVWAYELQWQPVPIFQTYGAYTPHLDGIAADRLADPRAPRLILHELTPAIDGRHPLWEAPRYTLERLCRYHEEMSSGAWQLLRRGPSRCGAEQQLHAVMLTNGQSVELPAVQPDHALVARIEVATTFGERVRSILFKPPAPIRIAAGGRSFRMVRANLSGPLLFRVPASSGYSANAVETIDADTFSIEGLAQPARVSFSEIAVASDSARAPQR